MRTFLAVFGVLWLSLTTTASATLIAYEGFNYDATGTPVLGSIAASGAWLSQGNGTVEPRITAGSLTFAGRPASVGNSAVLDNNNGAATGTDASRLTISAGSATTLYYSMLVSLPAYSNTTNASAYFAGFDGSATPYGSTFANAGSLFVKRDGANVDLGISNGAGTSAVYASTPYSSDPLFVVVSFTLGGSATLDVYTDGRSIPLSEPLTGHTAATSVVSSVTSVSNFYLRGNISLPQGITVDELRIGTTWADVVPEPGCLGLLLGVLPLARRRRR